MSKTQTSGKTELGRSTRFFTIWTGQAFSLFGSALIQFVLVWWLTETSGSAVVLTMANMMEVVPRVIISPLAGALIDRWNRRLVLILSDAAIALGIVVLAALYAMGIVQIWHIYIIMLFRGLGGAFHWPAMQASTTLLVPERHYGRVAGMNQTIQGLVVIVTPPLGALLYGLLSMQGILMIEILTALLAIGPLLFIAIPQPERKQHEMASGRQPGVIEDLRTGFQFVRGWPGLVITLAIGAVASMMATPAYALVPLLVAERLNGQVMDLAWIQLTFGIGVVVGGLTLSLWGGFKRRIHTVILASILGGMGFITVGLIPENAIRLATGVAFCLGFLHPLLNGSLMAMFQAIVPAEIQGRVFTLMISAIGIANPVGLAIAGLVGDAWGVHVWFVLCGIVTAAIGIFLFFIPSVMHIEERNTLKITTTIQG